MRFHPHSFALTLLVRSEPEDMEYATYVVLEHFTECAGYTDEYKADLYARLVEKLDPKQSLAEQHRLVSECMYAADRYTHGGY